MIDVTGVSAFGLKDCVYASGIPCYERQFQVSQALLPKSASGRIRTGMRAEKDRTHTGLHWPIEAQISLGEPVRRVPIPCVWRALVEAGDRPARWRIGNGVSFPIAKIIATHAADLIKDASDNFTETPIVLSIPNHLDEFGQENLLSELSARGVGNAMLLWRPVAAALSWLEKVQDNFIPKRMHPDDHIHIIYLGADCIEFTTLRLRPILHKGLYYILPLRDRPKTTPDFTGFDWVGRLVEQIIPEIDVGAFWQFFNIFPDAWEAIAGKTFLKDRPPRTWSSAGLWSLWRAPSNLIENAGSVSIGQSNTLRNILQPSFELKQVFKDTKDQSVNTYLQNQLSRMAEQFPKGTLRGLIITGPMATPGISDWLKANLDTFENRGLFFSDDPSVAGINQLWICDQCNDPVAEGAEIYGRRIQKGIPGYLDTMPQVYILAQEKAKYTWVPLLEAQEVLGGNEHTDRICGRFMLGKDIKKIDVYLYKGPHQEAEKYMEQASNPNTLSYEGIPSCTARLIRHIVRQMGSLKQILCNHYFNRSDLLSTYGKAFANSLYYTERNEEKSCNVKSLENFRLNQSSFRLSRINFPSSPPNDVKLDIEIRIRPASGLARVEIIPEERSFLHGRRVRLEYGKMRPPDQLPRFKRGWPSTQEIVVDPDDEVLKRSRSLVSRFERTSPTANDYKKLIDLIRNNVLKGTIQKNIFGNWYYLQSVDKEGLACSEEGKNIIVKIAEKFRKDFEFSNAYNQQNIQNMIFSRATWLYWKTPQIIIEFIKDIILEDYTNRWLWAVDSASRCLKNVNDYSFLFYYISKRIKKPLPVEPFPIQSARAIWRILMLRDDGEQGLDCDMAKLFAKAALKRLREQESENNFNNLYFQLIRFLLYLLRYRKEDPDCFDPNDFSSMETFDQAIISMSNAKKYCILTGALSRANRIQLIIDGFERYLQYEGSEDLLTLLSEEAGGID